MTYERMPNTSFSLNRATGADAACVNADPKIFGRPQHRLSKFLKAVGGTEVSVCRTDLYGTALQSLTGAIGDRLGARCLPGVPRRDARGQTLCTVGDVPTATPNALPAAPLPTCGPTCCDAWATAATPKADDPTIVAACRNEATSCYCAVSSTAGRCPGGAVLGVTRKAAPAPATLLSARCTTL